MPVSCLKVARGLLLYGEQINDGVLSRDHFLEKVGVKDNAFRKAGNPLGAVIRNPGARFFQATKLGLAFGPGAGLVLGISIGAASLRAALVDANGWLHHEHESEPAAHQLAQKPDQLLRRIRLAAGTVLSDALGDPELRVNGGLPFLGVSVAWGVPMDRKKRPLGPALASELWHNGQTLNDRVQSHLNLRDGESHALNDTHAAAIAFAFAESRRDSHIDQEHPRLSIVMRLAGGVGGATIAVEAPDQHARHGITSGFPKSILIGIGGSGELGHVPLLDTVIEARRRGRADLGDLVARRCSCTEGSQPVPKHLEAYTSTSAVAHRIAPREPECEVIRRIIDNPSDDVHVHALQDVGALVGHALLGPVSLLNPTTIALTGSLAVEPVRDIVKKTLSEAQVLGNAPEVRLLVESGHSTHEDKFVRAKGAALVVLRSHVYRRLEVLLEGRDYKQQVAELTRPLTQLPW